MSNKRGEGYILPCVLIIMLCVILSGIVTVVNTLNVVKTVKRNSITVLDSYVITNAVDIYDSIKQGNNYISSLDNDDYVERFIKFSSLQKKENRYVSYDSNGKTQYEVSTPYICFVTDRSLRIRVEYTVYVPIRFGGLVVSTAEVPVTVESGFNAKE